MLWLWLRCEEKKLWLEVIVSEIRILTTLTDWLYLESRHYHLCVCVCDSMQQHELVTTTVGLSYCHYYSGEPDLRWMACHVSLPFFYMSATLEIFIFIFFCFHPFNQEYYIAQFKMIIRFVVLCVAFFKILFIFF